MGTKQMYYGLIKAIFVLVFNIELRNARLLESSGKDQLSSAE